MSNYADAQDENPPTDSAGTDDEQWSDADGEVLGDVGLGMPPTSKVRLPDTVRKLRKRHPRAGR